MRKEQQEQLKNTIKCCISCILPCGALDVIRIVHPNGRVQEIACAIRAGDVLEAHPKYVLKTATSAAVIVVPTDAYLQRGKIYFLIAGPTPKPSVRINNIKKIASTRCSSSCSTVDTDATSTSSRRRQQQKSGSGGNKAGSGRGNAVISSDQYLTELLSEKVVSVSKERRRGRVGVWRPHLDTISETLS